MQNTYAMVLDGLVENVIVWDGATDFNVSEGVQLVAAPPSVGLGWTYDGTIFAPPAEPPVDPSVYVPIKISRLDFRRLLLPAEAARFRLFETAPRVTEAELLAAFDPEAPNPELQLRVAVEDCIQQWALLDEGVVELNHDDTIQFLEVMGAAGMFGADAAVRIPQILARQAPQ